MEGIELVEKNKNIILNSAIIVIALFVAVQIYKTFDNKVSELDRQKSEAIQTNKTIEEVLDLEKKTNIYKKIFIKKDMGYFVGAISAVAKESGVTIISLKPAGEEVGADYIKSSFLATLSSSSYHALGDFISKIENNKDIYIIGEVNLSSNGDDYRENKDLVATIRIITVAYN